MSSFCLQKAFLYAAPKHQARLAFKLVERRIAWMEEKGIAQWPREHYLGVFNQRYFEQSAAKGQLWLLMEGTTPLACAVLLEEDERWRGKETAPAYYVHNLAALPECPGAGERMLNLLEEKARQDGKTFLRLDCKTGARKINTYYRERGYVFVGYFRSAVYNGNLRQKKL